MSLTKALKLLQGVRSHIINHQGEMHIRRLVHPAPHPSVNQLQITVRTVLHLVALLPLMGKQRVSDNQVRALTVRTRPPQADTVRRAVVTVKRIPLITVSNLRPGTVSLSVTRPLSKIRQMLTRTCRPDPGTVIVLLIVAAIKVVRLGTLIRRMLAREILIRLLAVAILIRPRVEPVRVSLYIIKFIASLLRH